MKLVERLWIGMAKWLWSRTDDFWQVWLWNWHVWVLGFGGDHGNLSFQLVKV